MNAGAPLALFGANRVCDTINALSVAIISPPPLSNTADAVVNAPEWLPDQLSESLISYLRMTLLLCPEVVTPLALIYIFLLLPSPIKSTL